jgi:hypothetical protein
MKRFIPVAVLVAAIVVFVTAIGSAKKDDASLIDTVVGSMTAEEITPIDTGGGGGNPPELTVEKILAIVEKLKAVEVNGGLLGIARSEGASMAQVKAIQKRIRERLQELAPEPIEIE